jgi:hypothetical protein
MGCPHANLRSDIHNTQTTTNSEYCMLQTVFCINLFSDPRTRQLAEKQKQTSTRNDAVPEKLSFKEKMKMFALDAGENQTPKDKLKISRAQRDIDAVH